MNRKELQEDMEVRCLNCMKEYGEEYEICPHCGYVRGTPAKEPYMLTPGIVLAERYIIGSVLGSGGFATTYRAWDKRLDTMVAIKEYYPSGLVNRVTGRKEVILCKSSANGVAEYRRGLARFLEEAQNTAKFNKHENIIHVYDFFEENQTAYYVMEYLDGMDLSHYLKQEGGSIDVDTTTTILLSVIQALKAVHGAGIIHRDISPDNIFLCANNKVKLFDFGAARFSAGEEEGEYDIVLKPGYAPPEQYEKKSKQGPWTDIYALGATMYRAITGVLPDESKDRVDEDKVRRPREIKPEIPEYIDACLTRAMSLEPAFRFKTAEQFEEVLLSRRKVRSESEEQAFRKKVRRITVSVASVIILIGAGIGYQIYHSKEVAANLEAASISVWIPVEDETQIEAEQAMYENMSRQFETTYPDIEIEFVCVPEDTYAQQLSSPGEGLELPTLYSSDFGEDFLTAEPLEEVIELINAKDYYYLGEYETYFPKRDRMPLGFSVPVIYGNTTYMESGENLLEQNDKEQFYGNASALYIGDSSLYNEVQETIPGVYAVMPVLTVDAEGSFTNCWSVNGDAEDKEKAAAERLLYYWLGETAQDILHIQNVNALPLNQVMLDEYLLVNGELEFLEEYVEDIAITYRDEAEEENYYQELYQTETESGSASLEGLLQWLQEE